MQRYMSGEDALMLPGICSAGCGDVHLTGNLEGEVLVDAIRLMPAGEVRSVVETVREAMRAVMETA